jgi:RND family efflux transporter MFP subunit
MKSMHAKRTFAILAAAALALAACSNPGEGEANPLVAPVTVTRVERATIQRTITISGSVAARPNQDVQVSSLVPGRIVRMLAAEGDAVRKGQLLAAIDPQPFRDQLQQAEAAVAQAEANRENARLALARNQKLYQRGIAARKDLENAQAQDRVTAATLRQAQARLALDRLALARTRILSPLSGAVVKRFLSVGEQVDGTAAQPMYEVANAQPVELRANVPARYLGQLHRGETLAISAEAFPGTNFTGRVVAVTPAVDPSTNLGLVRIEVPNRRGLLRLGMFLTIEAPIETHRSALVLPAEAVYHDQENRTVVYRVEGGTAVATPVELGIETRHRDEVLSGVTAGETVVRTGGYGLGERTRIKITP